MLSHASTASEASTQEIDRISPEKVKTMLGREDVMIVDVRTAKDWGKGNSRIKGAVREHPKRVNEWLANHPKDKTIGFYCA